MILIRSSSVLVILLAVLGPTAATQELDAAKFKELTSSGKNGMVKFFQPWCGHCTAMKPAWDELAENADSSVFIADVNCSDQDDLCSENGVAGYPTIKVFKDGEVSDYSGGRSFDDLIEYVDAELAAKCDVNNLSDTCSERAVKFAEKWKVKETSDQEKEIKRLSGMSNKSMKAELKGWLRERLHILQQLAPSKSEEEL